MVLHYKYRAYTEHLRQELYASVLTYYLQGSVFMSGNYDCIHMRESLTVASSIRIWR